ncbi:MAG: 6-chlorohydroxyquinol-1,2-dioxygenase, partial [Pseudomonadota bacterium]
HYIVSKDGYDEVTKHIFDPDDIYIDNDAVFGVKESLIADFVKVEDPEKIAEMEFQGSHYWDVEFDFVLAPTI